MLNQLAKIIGGPASGLWLGYVARIWSQFVFFALFVYAGRVLSPESFGVYALAAVFIAWAQSFNYVGAYQYIVATRQVEHAKGAALFLQLFVSTVMILFLLICAGFADRVFRTTGVSSLIVAFAPALWLTALIAWLESFIVRQKRLVRYYFATTIAETVSVIAALIALKMGYGVYSFIIHRYINLLIVLSIYLASSAPLAPPRFEIDKIKEILRFGSGLYGSMVVTQTNFFAADFIIGVFLNPAAVAHYRMGSRMVNAVVDITGQPANKVNWAMMSSVERSASDIADVWPKMYSLFFCIVVSALACLAVIASDVIALFLGPSWAPAATVAVALCAVRALSSFELVATPIFGAKNRTGLLFKIRLAQMVLLLSSILYFARFGPTAAALGHAPAVVFGGVVVWLAIKQITGARNTAWPATIAAPLAVAVLTTFSLWTVKLIVQSITSNMAIVLFVALSVAAIVWLTSMRFLAWNALIKPIVAAWRETPT